ncbi:hypothetical protein JQX13_33290 [Archangium violaceum]|uniref:hypothetical protein n=1 Tax=Archangium violaceum TaxID=83451 RepID=UPI00193C66A3|nr:hypothetical protein [Archangium violaceum]QRK05059.1 hypothetical protein JQX13_33290 [Archangium violaceum]
MSISGSITIDDTQWPLLVVRFVGQPSLQQQEAYFVQMLDHLKREEKLVVIVDTQQVIMMTTENRQRLAEFVREHDALLRTRLLGCATIITSPVMQLAASLMLYLKPPPFPYLTASSLPEAVKWTAKCLDDAGLQPAAQRILRHHGLHEGQRAG